MSSEQHADPAGHAHSPGGHHHAPANFGRAFAIGIALNTGYVLVEAGYGFATGSVALVADAGHNLSDVFGLTIAWVAATLGQRAPSGRFTYGLRGSSILAALFNALFLLVAVGAIAWEAVRRFGDPSPVPGGTIMAVAAVGIAINALTAWLFARGRKGDLNIRGAYLHMAADAAVSAGVVISGFLILQTGWSWLDPATSLVIAGIIVWSTWGLLRESIAMALQAVPTGIDLFAVEVHLASLPGVTRVHDLHVWPMSTTEIALTAHLVVPAGPPGDEFLRDACAGLVKAFGIDHATLQIEADAAACTLAAAEVV